MIRKNKLRKHFLDRLNKLLHEYNTGSHDLDVFFDQLVEFAKELSEEDRRAVSENLTEEELAIFDILRKENLNPGEVDQVKKVAKELLVRLKAEKLVLIGDKNRKHRQMLKQQLQICFGMICPFQPILNQSEKIEPRRCIFMCTTTM